MKEGLRSSSGGASIRIAGVHVDVHVDTDMDGDGDGDVNVAECAIPSNVLRRHCST